MAIGQRQSNLNGIAFCSESDIPSHLSRSLAINSFSEQENRFQSIDDSFDEDRVIVSTNVGDNNRRSRGPAFQKQN